MKRLGDYSMGPFIYMRLVNGKEEQGLVFLNREYYDWDKVAGF